MFGFSKDDEHFYEDQAGNKWTLEVDHNMFKEVGAYQVLKNGSKVYGPDGNIKGRNTFSNMIEMFENKTGEFDEDESAWFGNTMGESAEKTDGFYDDTATSTTNSFAKGLGKNFPGSELLDIPTAGSPTLSSNKKDDFSRLVESYRSYGASADKTKLMNIIGSLNPELTEDQINAKLIDISSTQVTGTQKEEAYSGLKSDVYGIKGDIAAGFGGPAGTASTGMGTTARASRTAGVKAEKGFEDAYALYDTGLEAKEEENVDTLISSLIG